MPGVMFEFLRTLEVDAASRTARGEAVFDAGSNLLADHFDGCIVLPGSWLVEMGAQVAGLLGEEVFERELGVRRFAVLTMIRNATFSRPTPLPATLEIRAELVRREESFCSVLVNVLVEDLSHMRAEVVLSMNEAEDAWREAVEDRDRRLKRLLGTVKR